VKHKDYYEILGVDRNATRDEIQDAFHALARKYHPDVNSDPQVVERFKEISAAYEVLSDSEDRAKYDMQIGTERRHQQQTSSRPNGTAWHQRTTYNRRARTTWDHKWSRPPFEPSQEKHQDTPIVTGMAMVGLILILATLIINIFIDVINPSIKPVSVGWEPCVITVFFVAGVGALGWGLYLRRRNKCPRCGKPWANETLSEGRKETLYKEILLDGLPSLAYVQYKVHQRCKYCKHKWTSPREAVEVSFSKKR
jgi:hypothetical protein